MIANVINATPANLLTNVPAGSLRAVPSSSETTNPGTITSPSPVVPSKMAVNVRSFFKMDELQWAIGFGLKAHLPNTVRRT